MTARRRAAAVGLVALAVLAFGLYWRDGRRGCRVAAARMTNHDAAFDFTSPPCEPAPRPDPADADVRVAFLGVGGTVVEWRERVLATAPQFTRLSMTEAGFGEIRVDERAIAGGLTGFEPQRWDVILSGHAHYDHLADVPTILRHHAPQARLWTNDSGVHMLAAFPDLGDRVRSSNVAAGTWVRPLDADGTPLPFRFAPIESRHADHYGRYHYAPGIVDSPWEDWSEHKASEMREGQTFAFLIDLLDENGDTAFRIYYQDAVAKDGYGYPPEAWIAERTVDLAVLCAPAYWRVPDYPRDLLHALEARHAMPIHYEDFFAPRDLPTRFVVSLTDGRVDRLLRRLDESIPDATPAATRTCGPMGRAWTMPLPGEWVGFRSTPMLSSAHR